MLENIADAFRTSSAIMTFLTIFGAGLVVTLFSLVFGGDHDHGDVGHGDGDGNGDHGEDQGPSFFSIRGISLFATGFGGVGLLVMYGTKQVLTASLSGALSGVIFAFLGITGMRMMIRQQASSIIQPSAFTNLLGEVTTTIPEQGLGEVRVTVDGTTMTKTARALSQRMIPSGTTVRVVQSTGGTVLVRELAPDEQPR